MDTSPERIAGSENGSDTNGGILAWSMRANMSKEIAAAQNGSKRPGTKHFVPGAAIWVGPPFCGDGWVNAEMIGTKRGTKGKKQIRLIMATSRLVNWRMAPVYSPSLAEMFRSEEHYSWWEQLFTQPWHERPVKEIIDGMAISHNAFVTQYSHFLGTHGDRPWNIPRGRLHYVDHDCAFCTGVNTAMEEDDCSENPYSDERSRERSPCSELVGDREAWTIGWAAFRVARGHNENTPDGIAPQIIGQAADLLRSRLDLTDYFVGSSLCRSPLIGRTADEASQVTAEADIRTRFIFGEDDNESMIGRISVRLDNEDRVESVRPG